MGESFVIVNPASGQWRSRRVRNRLDRVLASAGLAPVVYETTAPGDAARAAAEACGRGFARIIVEAGDGTVHEAVSGMVGGETPLGILPLGTGNVLARELGMPLNFDEAVEALAAGRPTRMDVGRAGDGYFLIMAGYGADAEMVARVNPVLKRYAGQVAFYWEAVRRLPIERPRVMKVTVDGEERQGPLWLVAVANGEGYAPHITFSPEGRMGDGALDVALIGGSRWDLMRTLVRARRGLRPLSRVVEVLRGRHVRIECETPTHFHLDGDVIGAKTEVEFELIPQALDVIVPRRELA